MSSGASKKSCKEQRKEEAVYICTYVRNCICRVRGTVEGDAALRQIFKQVMYVRTYACTYDRVTVCHTSSGHIVTFTYVQGSHYIKGFKDWMTSISLRSYSYILYVSTYITVGKFRSDMRTLLQLHKCTSMSSHNCICMC